MMAKAQATEEIDWTFSKLKMLVLQRILSKSEKTTDWEEAFANPTPDYRVQYPEYVKSS